MKTLHSIKTEKQKRLKFKDTWNLGFNRDYVDYTSFGDTNITYHINFDTTVWDPDNSYIWPGTQRIILDA